MFRDVTPAVSRALELARALAAVEDSAVVRPLHLLHGLLAEEEGQAGTLAAASGLDWRAYRRVAPSLPSADGQDALPAFDPQTEAALRTARALVREWTAETEVSGELLLAALLRTDEESRLQLEALGLRVQHLESELEGRRPPPLKMDEPLALAEVHEAANLARVLDATANRAREGLRVAEDFCRFVLDDAFLSGELKRLRHDLTAALADLGLDLLSARDTENDVGTAVSTDAERRRYSLVDVAQVNLKRVQEALRSLEEFSKVPELSRTCLDVGQRIERLRYHSYTLEKAIIGSVAARGRLDKTRLCVLLTGSQCKGSLEWTIAEAAAGGADMVQLREKHLTDSDLLARAKDVRRWTRRAGVLFIVNDRPDIARIVEADGVHLGQDDLPVRAARSIVGPEALIGVSTHSVEQLRKAILDGASYVGVGPTFSSGTKEFGELAGLDFVRAAAAETSLPAFVIGGITPKNVSEAVAAGARRVAVSQAIAAADDPRSAAAALVRALPPT